MASCHTMKKGDIYACKDCGLEVQVIKQCKDFGIPPEESSCCDTPEECELTCCGKPFEKV